MRSRRSRHQSTRQRADDSDAHAEPQRPTKCQVFETMPPEGDRDGNGGERLDDDRQSHDREQHGVCDRPHVEMAWVLMMAISITIVIAVIQPTTSRVRVHSGITVKIHANVTV